MKGDLDTIKDLLDPEVKWHGGDPTDPMACHNRTEALAFMRQGRFRQNSAELVDVIGAGDKVVVITSRLEDGERVRGANLTTFRDGKVIEMVHYPDPAAALAAAGL